MLLVGTDACAVRPLGQPRLTDERDQAVAELDQGLAAERASAAAPLLLRALHGRQERAGQGPSFEVHSSTHAPAPSARPTRPPTELAGPRASAGPRPGSAQSAGDAERRASPSASPRAPTVGARAPSRCRGRWCGGSRRVAPRPRRGWGSRARGVPGSAASAASHCSSLGSKELSSQRALMRSISHGPAGQSTCATLSAASSRQVLP